jgi:hypothetical protein
VLDKVTEFSDGIMDKSFKVNGKMERKMDMEYGNHQRATAMKENGSKIGNMDKAFLSIGLVFIRDPLKTFWKMDMVLKNLWMEIRMKVNTKRENLMEKVVTNGTKEAITKVNLYKEWGKEEVNGWTKIKQFTKVIIIIF